MTRLTLVAVALILAASPIATSRAQAPARPATASGAVRPGTYDLELAMGGGTLQGTLVVAAAGDSLTARLHVGDHDAPVRSLTRKGPRVTLDVGGEGMKVVYDLTFDGDAVSGSFTFNGDPGFVTGKRRK